MTVKQGDVGSTSIALDEETPLVEHVYHQYASAPPPVRVSMVSDMIGEIYVAAPPAERGYLLKQLMRPVGLLSLAAIANGVFASIRFQGGFKNLQANLEDIQAIQKNDVVALANYVQQVSTQALNELSQILMSSPTLARSAMAVVLIKILMDRAKISRGDDSRVRSIPHFPNRRLNAGGSRAR